jgi:hypothetical protein
MPKAEGARTFRRAPMPADLPVRCTAHSSRTAGVSSTRPITTRNNRSDQLARSGLSSCHRTRKGNPHRQRRQRGEHRGRPRDRRQKRNETQETLPPTHCHARRLLGLVRPRANQGRSVGPNHKGPIFRGGGTTPSISTRVYCAPVAPASKEDLNKRRELGSRASRSGHWQGERVAGAG